MKKLIVGIMIGFFLAFASVVLADSSLEKINAFLKPMHIQLNDNGSLINQDMDALVYKDQTYVPLAWVGEKMGMTVSYFPKGVPSIPSAWSSTITMNRMDETEIKIKDPDQIVGIGHLVYGHDNQESITFQIKQYQNLPVNKPYLVFSFYDQQNRLVYTQGVTAQFLLLKKNGVQTACLLLDTSMKLDQSSVKITFSDVAPVTQHTSEFTPLSLDDTYVMNIQMSDVKTGWAIGNEIVLRTEDSGKSWINTSPKEMKFPGPNSGIGNQAIFFMKNKAWVVKPPVLLIREQDATVWFTQDGGHTWSHTLLPITNAWEQNSYALMNFYDETHGYVVLNSINGKDHTLYSTEDGGKLWKQEGAFHTLQSLPRDFKIYVDHTGWLVDDTNYYTTRDGGLTWSALQFDLAKLANDKGQYFYTLPYFYGDNDKEGILIIHTSDDNNQIFYTQDHGFHWRKTGQLLKGFNFNVTAKQISAIVRNPKDELYVSKDMGKTWIQKGHLPSIGNVFPSFIDDQNGWISDMYPGNVYRTIDGGVTWSPLRLPPSNSN